jgi:glycogen debranching enzyme
VTEPWAFGGAPPDGIGNAMTLVEGATFCVSERNGDIVPDRSQGLFVRDTRVLSRWELTVNGVAPELLVIKPGDPYTATFISRARPTDGLAESTVLVVRSRYIGDGMREDLTVRNASAQPAICRVSLAIGADFADLFEVKDRRAKPDAAADVHVLGDALRISRVRGPTDQGLLVRADGGPEMSPGAMTWNIVIPARAEWATSIEVVPMIGGAAMALRHPRGRPVEHAVPARRLREWRQSAPQLRTGDQHLAEVLRRSVEDLGALRIFDPAHPQRAVVAAGAPWFMALFGRDSLLTSWMLMPLDSSLAVGTLQTLADHQGQAVDLASEEEPGRILHEIRFGPATDFSLGGRSVYYGTADATPLFVALLGELSRWGYDGEVLAALLPHADRALDWIEHCGDADGDGFLEYQRKTESGLVNQGWKDSWDGITFADGRIAEAPIALAEVQGYCYAAYLARAHLAEEAGDPTTAARWADKAAALKRAFNEAFWLSDRGWFAVGLDRNKRPIDALTSNIGHCLWSGIVDDDKAAAVADHLLSDDMFSGWGIRTLAKSMTAYNPMSYHNGSVWPHDNAICVSGLVRYGFVEEGKRVAEALVAAAAHFDHRLPELFCGFDRPDFDLPVPYPAACAPQAWAAAAPVHLLRSLLRFDPRASTRELWCAPDMPAPYLPLTVDGLRLAGMPLTIDVLHDGTWTLSGLDQTGITLHRVAREAFGESR